jgi:methyl acetate hydrolase
VTTTSTAGVDAAALDRILSGAVESAGVPNVAAIVADRDGVLYEGGAGPRAAGEGDVVTVDTRFRLMSMTKLVATTVALQQHEKGALDLDAPVDTYCPAFADLQVLEGFDGDTPRLRPPASRATVKQLITHTSGLGYWFFSEDLVRWEAATGTPNVVSGSNRIFQAPLVADPGTQFVYGISTDWLGKVIEAVTGAGLDVVVKESVTGPLGMDRSTWLLDGDDLPACTPVHVRRGNGSWTAIREVLNQSPEWWAGGHGLYSTPSDYIRFQRALLRGGELDGERILSQASVDAAFSNQIGGLDVPEEVPTADPASSCTWRPGPGWKWGYGLLVNTSDRPGMRRAGSGAWAGLCNTQFWVDRTSGVCASVYSNFLPFLTPEAVQLHEDVERAVYASR